MNSSKPMPPTRTSRANWFLRAEISGAVAVGLAEKWRLKCERARSTARRKSLPFKVCRRQDLNLHCLNGNQALNLARLPIPPLRRRGLPLPYDDGAPEIKPA